jgi:Lrp/AsnC family leucine-responsive transcriptional regulator
MWSQSLPSAPNRKATTLMSRPTLSLDPTDRRIIEALRQDGRLSNVKLAARVGLSAAPCLRRVQELETSGVIEGYEARINLARTGLTVMAFSEIQMKSTAAKTMEDFEKAIARLPQVINCYVTSGGWDYMLEIHVEDLEAFEVLSNHHLTRLPGVNRVRSRFALRNIGKRAHQNSLGALDMMSADTF